MKDSTQQPLFAPKTEYILPQTFPDLSNAKHIAIDFETRDDQMNDKEGMGWPTYLLVSNPEGDFSIHGELKGGMPKGDFRSKLQALLQD